MQFSSRHLNRQIFQNINIFIQYYNIVTILLTPLERLVIKPKEKKLAALHARSSYIEKVSGS